MNSYLELSQGNEHKFYEVVVQGATVTTRYGRIGTDGLTQVKTFAEPAEASVFAGKKVAEKAKKGYMPAQIGLLVKKAATPQRLRLSRALQPYREAIEATIRPMIELKMSEELARPWQSKVGGVPYRLLGSEWPHDPQGTPLLFLAQINFGELPELPGFPTDGLVQFFIGTDDLYGCRFEVLDDPVQDTYRVLYHPQVINDLARLDVTVAAMPEDGYGPLEQKRELRLSGALEELPMSSGDRLFESVVGIDFLAEGDSPDDDLELGEYLEERYTEISEPGHQIGGYPAFTQEDPRTSEQFHILLFQLVSDYDVGVLWGDMGIGNFFIHPGDLARRDFSRVSYNWDCG